MLAALARQLTPDRDAVPDADLLDRFARTGDGAAFELLVWRHGAMVWAASRRLLGAAAAAEDASQAAFAALARHAGRVRGGSVGPWLHRVAVRAALDLRAAGRGHSELPAAHPADPHPGPAAVAAEREERTLIDPAADLGVRPGLLPRRPAAGVGRGEARCPRVGHRDRAAGRRRPAGLAEGVRRLVRSGGVRRRGPDGGRVRPQ